MYSHCCPISNAYEKKEVNHVISTWYFYLEILISKYDEIIIARIVQRFKGTFLINEINVKNSSTDNAAIQ